LGTTAVAEAQVENKGRRYEGMFLVEPSLAAKHWDRVETELRRILEKNNATVESFQKWGERKLAYPIERQKRGTYVLVYYWATGEQMNAIQTDIRLSEIILRSLILQTNAEAGDIKNVPLGDEPKGKEVDRVSKTNEGGKRETKDIKT